MLTPRVALFASLSRWDRAFLFPNQKFEARPVRCTTDFKPDEICFSKKQSLDVLNRIVRFSPPRNRVAGRNPTVNDIFSKTRISKD